MTRISRAQAHDYGNQFLKAMRRARRELRDITIDDTANESNENKVAVAESELRPGAQVEDYEVSRCRFSDEPRVDER